MIRRCMTAMVCAVICAATGTAQPVDVPSGQPVDFSDVVRDARGAKGLTWRFRFVAPEIDREKGTIDFETAAKDMDHLCNFFAIDRVSNLGPRPNQIIISFSSEPIDFGASDPEITQFFEVYAISEERCIWEPF